MRYRELGKTGLCVSELGFGTIPILSGSVPVLPEYFSPDTETAIAIMKKAFEYGCNFYDTAIPEEYGDAEIKLGEFVKTIDRSRIIISDKARFYSGGDIYREVIRSTEHLGTKPDIYFVHQVDEDNADEVFGKYGALDALYDLKREGKIGFTGIASHYYNVLYRGACDPRVDILQGSGNILERGMLERLRKEDAFREKGLILNKVYAAGLLIGPFTPAELIGGILEYPFSCALLGIGTFEQAETAFAQEYPEQHFSFQDVMERLRKVSNRSHAIAAKNVSARTGTRSTRRSGSTIIISLGKNTGRSGNCRWMRKKHGNTAGRVRNSRACGNAADTSTFRSRWKEYIVCYVNSETYK